MCAYQQKEVVLGLSAQILEDTLLPVAFHQVPIVNLTMANRIVDGIRLLVGKCLVTNVKVQVLNA